MLLFGELRYLIPEILLFVGLLVLFLYGTYYSRYKYIPQSEKLVDVTAVQRGGLWTYNVTRPLVSLTIVLLCLVGYAVSNVFFLTFNAGSLMFTITPFTSFFKMVIIFLSVCILFVAYYRPRSISFEFTFFILLLVLGGFFFLNSRDFIYLYISLELQTLALYLLIVSTSGNNWTLDSGLRYFIVGAVSSVFMAFGISLIYGAFGTVNLFDLHLLLSLSFYKPSLLFVTGLSLFLAGLMFKLGAVPFNFWVPDVYSGVDPLITLLIATLSKVPALAFLLAFTFEFQLVLPSYFSTMFIVFGVSSVLIGSLGAFREVVLRRFIGYSSISHMGYLLLALSAGTFGGVSTGLFYVVFYIFTSLHLIVLIVVIVNRFNVPVLHYISDFRLLSSYNVLSFSSIVCFLSLAGMPPFFGFFAKFLLLGVLFEAGYYYLFIFVLLTGFFSLIYYVQVLIYNFYNLAPGRALSVDFLLPAISPLVSGFLTVLLFLNLFSFLFMNSFLLFVHNILFSLYFLLCV